MPVQFLSKAVPGICMDRSSRISTGELWPVKWSESCSVMPDSWWPWNSPGQNTRIGNLSLFQGICPPQGSNPGLPHCRQILYQLSHREAQGLHKAAFNYFKHWNDSVKFVLRISSLYVFAGWVTRHTWGTSYKKSRQDILCASPKSQRGPKARMIWDYLEDRVDRPLWLI